MRCSLYASSPVFFIVGGKKQNYGIEKRCMQKSDTASLVVTDVNRLAHDHSHLSVYTDKCCSVAK